MRRTARQLLARAARQQHGRRILHAALPFIRYSPLATCALTTALAKPARCEGALVAPVERTKHWRVAKTLGGWSLVTAPVLLWAPLAFLVPWLRERWWRHALWAIERCGPTATKLAQWSATRPDVFSEAWCARCGSLQNKTTRATLSLREARRTLAEAFPGDTSTTLGAVVGAGCVAHVRRGLRHGRCVAVKLVHPSTRIRVADDVRALRWLAHFASRVAPRTCEVLDPQGLVEDFATKMQASCDMGFESAALTRLRRNFAKEKGIVFPEPFLAHAGCLVESFESGVPLSEAMPTLDEEMRKRVARRGLRALLKMLFADNYVHGDLHAGNLLLRFGDADFDLIILDAGLMIELSKRDRRNFIDLFGAVVQRDGRRAGELIAKRATHCGSADTAAFVAELDALVKQATLKGVTLRELRVAALLNDVLAVCRRHRIRLEANFATTVVAIAVVEGIGRQLDPELDLLREAGPFLARAAVQGARATYLYRYVA